MVRLMMHNKALFHSTVHSADLVHTDQCTELIVEQFCLSSFYFSPNLVNENAYKHQKINKLRPVRAVRKGRTVCATAKIASPCLGSSIVLGILSPQFFNKKKS